jgi:hypothetical protein
MRQLRNDTSKQRGAEPIEFMGKPVMCDGADAGVTETDFLDTPGGRITFEGGMDVFFKHRAHGRKT